MKKTSFSFFFFSASTRPWVRIFSPTAWWMQLWPPPGRGLEYSLPRPDGCNKITPKQAKIKNPLNLEEKLCFCFSNFTPELHDLLQKVMHCFSFWRRAWHDFLPKMEFSGKKKPMELYRFRRLLAELAEPAELPGVAQKPENGARVTRAGNRDDVSMPSKLPQTNSLKLPFNPFQNPP